MYSHKNPSRGKRAGRIWNRGSWSDRHPKSNLSLSGNMGGIALTIISAEEGQRI